MAYKRKFRRTFATICSSYVLPRLYYVISRCLPVAHLVDCSDYNAGMMLDVGGAACRVLYQPATGNAVKRSEGRQIFSLYTRSNRSAPELDEEWIQALGRQENPQLDNNEGGNPTQLPTHVVLPRHMPLSKVPLKRYKQLSNASDFLNSSQCSENHVVSYRKSQ